MELPERIDLLELRIAALEALAKQRRVEVFNPKDRTRTAAPDSKAQPLEFRIAALEQRVSMLEWYVDLLGWKR